MKIGETLPPFWRNFATILWVIGLGLMFASAMSSLWGWLVVGPVSCVALLAFATDERKAIRCGLSTSGRTADRLFAIYILTITTVALVTNMVVLSAI